VEVYEIQFLLLQQSILYYNDSGQGETSSGLSQIPHPFEKERMKERKGAAPSWPPPLGIERTHLVLYIAGLVIIVIGYLLMSVGPWDNPISRSLAPVVLLVAYIVVIPLAILWKGSKAKD
jgi:hypothetical protein